jgi:hypothetical protein
MRAQPLRDDVDVVVLKFFATRGEKATPTAAASSLTPRKNGRRVFLNFVAHRR